MLRLVVIVLLLLIYLLHVCLQVCLRFVYQNSPIVEGHLKVKLDKRHLHDLVIVADERVQDAADVGRVELGVVDGAERTL